jgi:hypothetical protein
MNFFLLSTETEIEGAHRGGSVRAAGSPPGHGGGREWGETEREG